MRNFLSYIFSLASLSTFAQNLPNGATSVGGSYNQQFVPAAVLNDQNQPYSNFNYTRVAAPRVPITTPFTSLLNASFDVDVSSAYTDGWGNPMLSVRRSASHTGKDVVVPFAPNNSKTKITFLPYPDSSKSKFQINPMLEQKDYYQNLYPSEVATAVSKSVTDLSGSPATFDYAPGKGTVGQSVGTKKFPDLNTTADDIKIWTVDINGLPYLSGTYADNQLNVDCESGQNQTQIPLTRQFKDKEGKVLCKRVGSGSGALTTYYVYDDLGLLRWILPPKAVVQLSANGWSCTNANGQSTLDKLCYKYNYNEHGLLIEKKNPDRQGSEFLVYDKKLRPVLSQTPLLATSNKWRFTVYDSRDRVVLSGVCTPAAVSAPTTTNLPASTWTSLIAGATPPVGNPQTLLDFFEVGFNGLYPPTIAGCDIEQYNYYDRYSAYISTNQTISQPVHAFDYGFSLDYVGGSGIGQVIPRDYARGKLTASKTKIVNGGSGFANQWISSVYHYDDKGRVIQVATLNPWNTTNWDVITTQYDFQDHPVQTINQHYGWTGTTVASIKLKTRYTYQNGKLHRTTQSINNSAFRDINQYEYDDLERVSKKIIGGISVQQYTFNLRGQLQGINELYLNSSMPSGYDFAEQLSYDFGFNKPRYDGKISGFIWRTKSFPVISGGTTKAAYGYDYDGMGRLTSADYNDYNFIQGWNKASRDFSLSNVSYDENGNILKLRHRGPTTTTAVYDYIDDLTYTYDGNRLTNVMDYGVASNLLDDFEDGVFTTIGPKYFFDENGNLKQDDVKGINQITYNDQDLPLSVASGSGSVNNVYDAAGTLLSKTITQGTNTTEYRYWGPFVYKNDNTNSSTPWNLDYLLHDEGRCRYLADSGFFKYDYFIKDHLDNVRLTVTADEYSGKELYFASHEIASSSSENLLFSQLDDVRDDNPDGTPADQYAANLNGADPERRIGTSLLIRAMEGDKIKISTKSFFTENGDPDMHTSAEDMLASIVSVLTANPNPGSGNGEGPDPLTVINNTFSTQNYIQTFDALKESQTNPNLPRAYLNYLVFDEEFRLMTDKSGVLQAGATQDQWNVLDLPEFSMDVNGYVAIYISNEQHMDLFFDAVSLTHYRGRKLDEQHYYPHGMLINKFASNTQPANKFRYQGKLMQDELGLQLYDFHVRQYDPQIGRFWGVDPMDQFPAGYTGMGNDPANFTDPTGMVASGTGPSGPSAELSMGSWIEPVLGEPGFGIYEKQFDGTVGPYSDAQVDDDRETEGGQGIVNEGGITHGEDPQAEGNSSSNLRKGQSKTGTNFEPEEKAWDLNGDGKLQKNEADSWYLHGKGQPILVDGKKIDLNGLDASDMEYNPQTDQYKLSTTRAFIALPWETASTYGGSHFKYVNGHWQMQNQGYHYELRPWGQKENNFRNILNILGDPSMKLRPSQMNEMNGKPTEKGTPYEMIIKY